MEAGQLQQENGTNGHDESRAGRPSLAVLLNEAGLASSERVQAALAEGMKTGEKLGEVLIRQGAVSEEQLAQLLAKQWELPYVRADALTVDPFALRRLSAADARELGALPVRFDQSDGPDDDGRLLVAIAEPSEERFTAIAGAVGTTEVSYEVVAHSTLERLLRSRLTGPDTDNAPDVDVDVDADVEVVDAEPPADHPHPNLNEVADSLEDAAARLRSLQSQVDVLRSALRLAEKQIDDYERRLADAERDRETLRKVEDELARREQYIDTLRGKVGELNDALASP